MLKAAEFFVGGQQLVRLNEKVIGEVSRDHGINATEMSILLFLAGNPDLNTAKDIVESRLMTKSSVSPGRGFPGAPGLYPHPGG